MLRKSRASALVLHLSPVPPNSANTVSNVTIFDKRTQPGGLNTYGVAQYKFTPDDAAREVELVRATDVEFRSGVAVGDNMSIEDLEREL